MNRPKSIIDNIFLTPFLCGVVDVFAVQAKVTVTQGAPQKRHAPDLDLSIAGSLKLDCEQFSGTVNMYFSKQVFLEIYKGVSGEKLENIEPKIEDCASEIMSMVFGQAKTVLKIHKYEFKPTIAKVLRGDEIKEQLEKPSEGVIVPFNSEFGPFYLEIIVQG